MLGGYTQGETKRIVMVARDLGWTVEETMRRSGKSYASIYRAAKRNGFKLKSENPKEKWGSIKQAVAEAEASGISAIELQRRTGFKINSIRYSMRDYGFKLKHHKDFLREKSQQEGKMEVETRSVKGKKKRDNT